MARSGAGLDCTINMSLDGFLQMEEGSLYWLLESPETPGARASERPTRLFIHAG